jgi:Icc-related predicted phosphoesterase
MRLLLVADLHYSLPQFDWVVEMAPTFDVVVMAGDHLDIGSIVDGRAQSVVVRKYFNRLRELAPLLICSGNHDLDSKSETGEKVARWLARSQHEGIPSDGDSFTFEDTLFTICPWWDGPVVRARIVEQLAEDAKHRPMRWIWVHHAPPAQSPTSWGGSRYYGDVELKEWIERYQPDFVLSGHVHQSPFVRDGSWVDRIGRTWVFNAGQHPGTPPAHVVIDTDEEEAMWFSLAGREFVHLDQPLTRPVAKLPEIPEWLKDDWLRAVDPTRLQAQG